MDNHDNLVSVFWPPKMSQHNQKKLKMKTKQKISNIKQVKKKRKNVNRIKINRNTIKRIYK